MTDELIEAAAWKLVSEDRTVRTEAYKIIKEFGGSAVPVLMQVAREWDEKQQGCWLGIFAGGSPTESLVYAIKDAAAIEPLESLMGDPDPVFRRFAVFALCEINDPRVLDIIEKAANDDDPVVRSNAVRGYCNVSSGNQKAFELTMHAIYDPDERVRKTAANILRRVGGPESVDVLISALNDPSEKVAVSAASTIGVMRAEEGVEPLIRVLQSQNNSVVSSAIRALGKLCDSRAVDPLLQVLNNSDYFLRSSALEVLNEIDPNRAISSAINSLHDLHYMVRKSAVDLLGNSGNNDMSDYIAQMLDDEEPSVRQAALNALATLSDNRAFEPLVNLLKIEPKFEPVLVGVNPQQYRDEDENRFARERAAKFLGILGNPSAIQPLVDALADPSTEINAAVALSRIGNDRGIQHLLSMLDPSHKKSYSLIIRTLGDIKDIRAVKPLIKLLDSNEPLGLSHHDVLNVLGSIGSDEAIDKLKSIVAEGQHDALDAALALAKAGYDVGFDYLRSELESCSKPSWRVMHKLRYINDQRAIDLMIDALNVNDDTYKIEAIQGLCGTDDSRVFGLLSGLLDDESRQVRLTAWRGINKIKCKIRKCAQ
ncbi:HEAT repeat domain-containing protein [uncultured Desulfobulbus sp.]|uniref:HEAT repeat domain-containing protein n=1 Tax=uncultured Desulfobulbus sp. TaxID=239745 RepID=UPI0029C6976C|nr:HEAT repeat domain-containing protein [uncultured Desulfobulbus sp.]